MELSYVLETLILLLCIFYTKFTNDFMYHKSNYTTPKINVNIFYRRYCHIKQFKVCLVKMLHSNNYDIFSVNNGLILFFYKKTTKDSIILRPKAVFQIIFYIGKMNKKY